MLADEHAAELRRPVWAPVERAAGAEATLLVAWHEPGRARSEAAFARLAGVAPIPASSGTVVRHRLDRGSDCRPDRTLHTIVLLPAPA